MELLMAGPVSLPGGVTLDGPRGRTYASILETVGSTPLVAAPKFAESEGVKATLLFKCEFFNPLASVKDRIGLNMILQLEATGKLKPGGTLVEPTSGNTGIALAFVAASRGYRLILTMPESMSIERRRMLAYLGAELELTPKEKGMGGAIAKAKEILEATEGAVMPSQFDNPANPAIHEVTTAEEIWTDTDGAVDAVIAGIGTGGTFTGCGKVLKTRKPELKMYAVEPEGSPVLSGGEPGPHMIQGIGAGFIPGNADTSLLDEVVKVSNDEAFATARKLAMLEGIPGGISSGAAAAAAVKIGQRDEMEGKTIVTILPSFAERYVSTALFDGL
ncbi:cysteine synthase [Hyphomonas pacifica]|uniref:cysteine synthase n=2 Tax=Hyphomonas pacifica TaxID=1280941 RepID=A0A8B2PTZ3_9PROT|nr:cysteine synthase [Hyphomonas pacifica]RAN35758.1 cysteine synthase [Hyphomonas pacifica]